MGVLHAALRGVVLSAIIVGIAAFATAGAARADATPFATGGLGVRSTAFSEALRIPDAFATFGLFRHRPLKFDYAALDPLELIAPPARQPAEPFDVNIAAITRGAIVGKWTTVKKRLAAEHKILEWCRADVGQCPAAATSFLALLDKAQAKKGWLRIAEVNRAINLNIRPMSDRAQYGVGDLWATPLMLFASHRGDCEDYAIAKYVALREVGIAEDDIRLVIVRDHAAHEDHAVTAVRYDGQWRLLDNRSLAIRTDVATAEFEPLFVIDRTGVNRIAPESPRQLAAVFRAALLKPSRAG